MNWVLNLVYIHFSLSNKTVTTLKENRTLVNVSPEAVTLTVEDLMGLNDNDEPVIPGIEMKGLSSPISRRHHALIRMEALRRKCSTRTLIKSWLRENVRDWIIEPVESPQSSRTALQR